VCYVALTRASKHARDPPFDARIAAVPADAAQEAFEIAHSIPQLGLTIAVYAFALAEFIIRNAISVGRKT